MLYTWRLFICKSEIIEQRLIIRSWIFHAKLVFCKILFIEVTKLDLETSVGIQLALARIVPSINYKDLTCTHKPFLSVNNMMYSPGICEIALPTQTWCKFDYMHHLWKNIESTHY